MINKNTDNRNTGYKLYNKILLFNKYSRSYILSSIPKVYADIKIHYADELYSLTKNMFYATYNKGNIRMKYLVDAQVNLGMLDFLLNELKEIESIKNKNINSAINILTDIKNIIYGWKFNEEEKKK